MEEAQLQVATQDLLAHRGDGADATLVQSLGEGERATLQVAAGAWAALPEHGARGADQVVVAQGMDDGYPPPVRRQPRPRGDIHQGMSVDDVRPEQVEHFAEAAFDGEIELLLELGPLAFALGVARPVLHPEVVVMGHAEDGDAGPLRA